MTLAIETAVEKLKPLINTVHRIAEDTDNDELFAAALNMAGVLAVLQHPNEKE